MLMETRLLKVGYERELGIHLSPKANYMLYQGSFVSELELGPVQVVIVEVGGCLD